MQKKKNNNVALFFFEINNIVIPSINLVIMHDDFEIKQESSIINISSYLLSKKKNISSYESIH